MHNNENSNHYIPAFFNQTAKKMKVMLFNFLMPSFSVLFYQCAGVFGSDEQFYTKRLLRSIIDIVLKQRFSLVFRFLELCIYYYVHMMQLPM